ncbi:HEPN domain-containing protein [Catenulispora sp. GAS73]|uniref:hypothetical protein n=1 Tax=Catenulispora sp. GAS73 TaxID=3156269 RepID=UPI0035148C51
MSSKKDHVQQTFLQIGDEFLLQYLLCAHNQLKGKLVTSRLFSMGHSLEVYLKAALINDDGKTPKGHDVPALIEQFDASLSLNAEEQAVGDALFSPALSNFDLTLFEQHREALELYQAERFLRDLKYSLNLDNEALHPVHVSLQPINLRYLSMVHQLRSSIEAKTERHDRELREAISAIGFDVNPADLVLGDS